MVVIDGVKYACQRCIRGHRVSGCNHTNQELHIVKRKGRPSTMCSYCRRARQSRPSKTRRTGAVSPAASFNQGSIGQCTCASSKHQPPEVISAGHASSIMSAFKSSSNSQNSGMLSLATAATSATMAPAPAIDAQQQPYGMVPPMDNILPLSPPESVCGEAESQNLNAQKAKFVSGSVLENLSMNCLSSVNDVPLRRCMQQSGAPVYEPPRAFPVEPRFKTFMPGTLRQYTPPTPSSDVTESNHQYHLPQEYSPMSYLYSC